MPLAQDVRKTLTDPTPLYFAAGVLDKIRQEAPDRLAAARERDPKELQEKLSQQAKQTQEKVSETLTGLDADLKKLREQAQRYALQGVGLATEYAVKAKEGYDELALRGRGAVTAWRNGEEPPEVSVERTEVKVAEPPEEPAASNGTSAKASSAKTSATTSKPTATGTTAKATSKTSAASTKKTATTSTSATTRKSPPRKTTKDDDATS